MEYKSLCLVGLAIWLVFMIVGFIIPSSDNEIDGLWFPGPLFGQIILLLVIGPIVEELAFRGWLHGSKVRKWLSVTVSAFMVGAALGLTWGITYAIVMILVLLFQSEKSAFSTIIPIVISSAAFALIHSENFTGVFGIAVGVLSKFGFSIVVCCLVHNWGLWTSIIIHILNNAIALILIQTLMCTTYSYSNDVIDCTIRPMAGSNEFNNSISSDTIRYSATIGGMVEHLAQDYYLSKGYDIVDIPILFRYNNDFSKHGEMMYDIVIHSKKDLELTPDNNLRIIKEMERLEIFDLDTTYEEAYLLECIDPKIDYQKYSYSKNLIDLMYELRCTTNFPIVIDPASNGMCPVSQDLFDTVSAVVDLGTANEILSAYGFGLGRAKGCKVQIISIQY